ncbi:MAG: transglycosylase SLT domain-containing protein [Pseudomonadota bacterium]
MSPDRTAARVRVFAAHENCGGCKTIAVICAMLAAFNYAAPAIAQDAFKRPAHVAQAVDFWSRVYSEIDTQTGFIHDRRDPQLVYEVYPLDAGDTPRRQQRDIDQRLKQYRRLLADMIARQPIEYDAEQQRVAALMGALHPSEKQLRTAVKQIRFQRGQADRFAAGVARQRRLGVDVRQVLEKHGLPVEINALPHVESSYNPSVKSHAGALGLWQIMPATARRYLTVNRNLDERLDVKRSTEAAARLLKHNYGVLKDWSLAVTAYNRGLAGVRRAIRETGSRDIGVISRDYEGRGFGFASRNFYAAFLAAHDVSSGQFPAIAVQNAGIAGNSDGETFALRRYLPIYDIAQEFSVPVLSMKHANPKLTAKYWNAEKWLEPGYALQIPGKLDSKQAEAALRSLEALSGLDQQQADRYYRIKKGDKLALLARDFQTDMTQLMNLNGVSSVHRIYAGQILRLPSAEFASLASPQLPIAQAPRTSYAKLAVRAEPKPIAEPIRGQLVYGVLRDTSASRDVLRYAFEAMRLSTPNAWDIRVASSVSSLTAVPESISAGLSRRAIAAASSMFVNNDSQLAADPADYLVASDGSIEIQVGETLGHYAHWLGVHSSDLRRLNNLSRRQAVVVGGRIRLSFEDVDRRKFERYRRLHHEKLQQRYFAEYRITGVQNHSLGRGDNLWELATSEYGIPLWLLRQYNPDFDFGSVLAVNEVLSIPVVTAKS